MSHQCLTSFSLVFCQCFSGVSSVLLKIFISVLKVFWGCLFVITATRAYGGLVFFTHSFKPFRCVTVSSIVLVSLVRLIGDQPSPLTSYYLGTCYHYTIGTDTCKAMVRRVVLPSPPPPLPFWVHGDIKPLGKCSWLVVSKAWKFWLTNYRKTLKISVFGLGVLGPIW